MWTIFYDMSSQGIQTTDYKVIIIRGGKDEATKHFIDVFNENPNDVRCECCGENFNIHTEESLDKFIDKIIEFRSKIKILLLL